MSVISGHVEQYISPRQQEIADMAGANESLADDLTQLGHDTLVHFDVCKSGECGVYKLEVAVPLDGAAESLADQLIVILAGLVTRDVKPCHSAQRLLKTLATVSPLLPRE